MESSTGAAASLPALQRMVKTSHPIEASWRMYEASAKIWNESCKDQLAFLRAHPETTQQLLRADDPKCKGTILLIEAREHGQTEFVLRNWVHFLAPLGWSLTVAHSSSNEKQVREIIKSWSNVAMLKLPKDDYPGIEYNKLLTDPSFWEKIPHENILLVQTDTMCLTAKGLGGGGDDTFLHFDYVGAPWHQTCPITGRVLKPGVAYKPSAMTDGQARCELWPDMIGNGGCSFRNRSAMVLICNSYQLSYVHDDIARAVGLAESEADKARLRALAEREVMITGPPENRIPVRNEDIFFAVACKRMGMNLPTREQAVRFCIEETLPLSLDAKDEGITAALHKVYTYQPPEVVRHLVESSQLKKKPT